MLVDKIISAALGRLLGWLVGCSVARLVVRDGRVFNGTDGTYQFSDDSLTELDLYITRLQDWDELPLASRKAIAAQAALEYLTQVNADPIKLQMAQAKAYQTLNAHRGSDLQQRDANIFGDGGTPFRAVTRTTRTWNPRYPKF